MRVLKITKTISRCSAHVARSTKQEFLNLIIQKVKVPVQQFRKIRQTIRLRPSRLAENFAANSESPVYNTSRITDLWTAPDFFEVTNVAAEFKATNATSLKKRLPVTIRMLATATSKVHVLRNPSVASAIARDALLNLNGFSTHLFTTGTQHAFFPCYAECYHSNEKTLDLIPKARYVADYNQPNASSLYGTIVAAPNRKFFATPTLRKFINVTYQTQLILDMLSMTEHSNNPIEGIIIVPRQDASYSPQNLFTWDQRSIIRDIFLFGVDIKFFDNVHMI